MGEVLVVREQPERTREVLRTGGRIGRLQFSNDPFKATEVAGEVFVSPWSIQ